MKSLTRQIARSLKGRAERGVARFKYRLLKPVHCSSLPASSRSVPLIDSLGSEAPWIYHDERWDHVVHRWRNRQALGRGDALALTDAPQPLPEAVRLAANGRIRIREPAESSDEWVYLNLDPSRCDWGDYSWKLRFRCWSNFKELQFGFRYQDFYNRYRYRFQGGKLCFDMVVNGQFHADLSVRRCKIELGAWYQLEIRAVGNVFQCWLDGKLVSRDYDPLQRFPRGSIALILWEDDGVTPIEADIEMESVVAL